MRQLFLLLIALFTSGCIHHANILELKPYTKLSGPNISLQTPEYNFNASWRSSGITGARDWINIWRQIPNMMSEDVRVTVTVHPKDDITKVSMLYKDKNDAMEEHYRNFKMSDWEVKNNAERGVTYVKRYVDFIGGLKCATRVESSNIALGVGTKSYQTNCNYFDNQQGAKNIHIDYRYTYAHSGTKHDGDTQSGSVSPETMQLQFKQDMKAIFDSLVVHDMDGEKMGKEGLLHERKYEVDSENKAKNTQGE